MLAKDAVSVNCLSRNLAKKVAMPATMAERLIRAKMTMMKIGFLIFLSRATGNTETE